MVLKRSTQEWIRIIPKLQMFFFLSAEPSALISSTKSVVRVMEFNRVSPELFQPRDKKENSNEAFNFKC